MDIDKLGRYDIVRVLGKGAMGVVYEGRDPFLDRPVAIKTIRVQSMSKEAAAEYDGRFRTEARSAARLHHPNIVSVFDSGQDGDTAYLVMEFIQGDDLKHHLERGVRFSVRAAITMVHDLLLALDHAHRQNVVHRDIKPANILIEASGRIKLADFGVARIQEPDEANLTQVGAGAVGTPKYMSPEQAKGLRVDSRSDVFSAGVVLYELLTGIKPFDGDNQFVVINQIVTHVPAPPSRLNPEVPAAIDEVMVNALAKLPDERFGSAREFALALRGIAQQLPQTPGATPEESAASLGARSSAGPSAGADLHDGSSTGTLGVSAYGSLGSTLNHEVELEYWKDIKDSNDGQDFQSFLDRFPSGIYAPRARRRLERLSSGDTQAQGLADSGLAALTPAPTFAESGSTGTGTVTGNSDFPDTVLTSGVDPEATVGGPVPPVITAPAATAARAAAPAAANAPSAKQPDNAAKARPASTKPAPGSKKLLYLGLGGLVCLAAVAALLSKGSGSVAEPAKPVVLAEQSAALPASAPQVVASEPQASAASAPALPAAVVASAAQPAASKPRARASAPARAASKPAVAAVVAPVVVEPAKPAITPVSAAPVATVAPVTKARPAGPSAAGQVCADKVFVFRITCLAEQCLSDRYRQSEECIEFKALEKKREEQRSN